MMVDIPENKREKLIQFIKFGLVGVSNNLICYGTYVLLINIRLHYVPSNIIGFSISVFNAFYWNNKYVFSDSDGSRVWWKTFIKTYISYAGTGIILSNILLAVWVEIFRAPEVIAPIINLVITVPINFLTNKYWAYKSK